MMKKKGSEKVGNVIPIIMIYICIGHGLMEVVGIFKETFMMLLGKYRLVIPPSYAQRQTPIIWVQFYGTI